MGSMSTHEIPEAAVEAAAKAHQAAFAAAGQLEWNGLPKQRRDALLLGMRAALEAAAPHIAAQVLTDAVDAFPLETITAPGNAVAWLRSRAEQIRRQA